MMRFGIAELAPSPPLITMAEAKAHLRVDFNADDALITRLIGAATTMAERRMRRPILARQWRMTLEGFPSNRWASAYPIQDGEINPPRFGYSGDSTRYPDAINLPLAPVQSIDSINYVDINNASQLLAGTEYVASLDYLPPRIVPAAGKSWPATGDHPSAVTIVFLAGITADPLLVPGPIVQATLLILGHLYEHREDVTPGVGAPSPAVLPRNSDWLLMPYMWWPW